MSQICVLFTLLTQSLIWATISKHGMYVYKECMPSIYFLQCTKSVLFRGSSCPYRLVPQTLSHFILSNVNIMKMHIQTDKCVDKNSVKLEMRGLVSTK